MLKQLNAQIKELERQIATTLRAHADGPIFRSLFKGPNSVITAAELLAEIGDCRGRYPARDALAATPAKPRSRSSQASARQRPSPGAVTSAYARRSTRWLTAPHTGTLARKISTPPPAPAATITPARCAPSAAPGVASRGAAGKTACR